VKPLPPMLQGLGPAPYDGFILDLWGVVHDGVAPFPAAIDALLQIKKSGRQAWLLSNAPRRVSVITERLSDMGIGSHLYDGLMTSGEASHLALAGGLLQKWGRKCFHMGAAKDNSILVGLDVDVVQDIGDAEFILNSLAVDAVEGIASLEPLLVTAAERNIPMLCANPDMIVHVGERLLLCAGSSAEMYEKMGGNVTYFGKPHRDVYSHVFKSMQGAKRILAVGDSMVTDIRGAVGAGVDSALVVSGIHREEYANIREKNFLAGYIFAPTYLMDHLRW
jgi:HAD superfamily hydrolase (TIGR01459 family)